MSVAALLTTLILIRPQQQHAVEEVPAALTESVAAA